MSFSARLLCCVEYSYGRVIKMFFFVNVIKINKWTVPGTSVASHVRSLRKGNSDQVAIAIDGVDPASNSKLEDEDDDKGNSNLIVIHVLLRLMFIEQIISLQTVIMYFFPFTYSSWVQVTYYIKNCSKVYENSV